MFGKKPAPLEREWIRLIKKEAAMEQAAYKAIPAKWKEELEAKVPERVLTGLQSAFCKGFSMVFRRGTKLLEKTYRAEDLRRAYHRFDQTVMATGKRRDLRQLRRSGQTARWSNLAVTTVEGVGLGALGIGMPDIVIFLSVLLRGIYETALRFGFSYDTPREQLLILRMMEAALSRGEDRLRSETEVERLLRTGQIPTEDQLQAQLRRTADVFAVELLLVKFVQGLPVVGVLGGAANPVYYNKVLQYVQLKYHKRYLRSVAKRTGIVLKGREARHGQNHD